MPEYIDPEVEELRDSGSNERVTLLVGASGDRDELQERLSERGMTVEDTLGQATLRVTAAKSSVDVLCGLEGVKSIELDREDVRILDSGNGHSRRRVTRY